MTRLLKLLLVFALVAGQGPAFAAAVCRHQNAREHELARESRDPRVAAIALNEEAADAAISKKGTSGAASAFSLAPADLPVPGGLAPPMRIAKAEHPRPADAPALAGTATAPPVPPPLG